MPKPEDMRAAVARYVEEIHRAYLAQALTFPAAVRGRMPLLAPGPLTVAAVGVDGCGAPAFALSLRGLARAAARIALARGGAESEIAAAMRAHPELVGGTGRSATRLMANWPGLIAPVAGRTMTMTPTMPSTMAVIFHTVMRSPRKIAARIAVQIGMVNSIATT